MDHLFGSMLPSMKIVRATKKRKQAALAIDIANQLATQFEQKGQGTLSAAYRNRSKVLSETESDRVAQNKLNLLLPFKGLMKKALAKRGVALGRNPSLLTIAKAFKKYIVDKRPSNYDEQDKLSPLEVNHIAPVVVTLILGLVTAILSFFKDIKSKRDKGDKLTDSEQGIMKGMDKVDEAVKKSGFDGVINKIKKDEKNKELKKLIPIAGLVAVGIFLVARGPLRK